MAAQSLAPLNSLRWRTPRDRNRRKATTTSPKASSNHFLDLAPIGGEGTGGRAQRSSGVSRTIPIPCNGIGRAVRCGGGEAGWSLAKGTFREHFTCHYLAGRGALQRVKPGQVSL